MQSAYLLHFHLYFLLLFELALCPLQSGVLLFYSSMQSPEFLLRLKRCVIYIQIAH